MRRSIQSFYIPLGTTHGHLAVVGTPWMGELEPLFGGVGNLNQRSTQGV